MVEWWDEEALTPEALTLDPSPVPNGRWEPEIEDEDENEDEFPREEEEEEDLYMGNRKHSPRSISHMTRSSQYWNRFR